MTKAPLLCAVLLAFSLTGCEVGVEQPLEAEAAVDQNQLPAEESHATAGTATRVERGHLRFVEGYQNGYQKALKEGKPMLVFFTAQWCHFCHQMASDAFTHQQVVDLSERFVCILVDADAEPEVCEQFQVKGYPTIQFLSPRGVPLNQMVGKKPGHQLMIAMQAALQHVARRAEAPGRHG